MNADVEAMREFVRRSLPVCDDFGERFDRVAPGKVCLSLDLRPEHISHDLPRGSGQKVLSGPLMMGLADTAMYAAVHTLNGPDVLATIVDLNVSFQRLPGTNRLIVEAAVLRRLANLWFVEARLMSAPLEDAVARVTATYAVWRDPKPQ